MLDDTALTPIEVAEILKISKNTVYELIKRGELNSYRVGKKVRVDTSDVEAYKNKTKSNKINNLSIDKISAVTSKPEAIIAEEKQFNNAIVICGQDVMLDILSRQLERYCGGVQILRSYIGSYNGLYSLYQGNVQVATAHLWDGDTGEYNIPYVKRLLPGTPAIIVHLACRMQGFYVAKGNPKGVKGWEDLKREDITIINREKGSGTRILLDEHLRIMGINHSSIKGYDRECFSHLAVASAVARGGADIAVGNEKNGQQVKGIDFIPLQNERFELVVKKEDLNKSYFQSIINILNSDEFKMELEGIGGYDLTDLGKYIIEE